MTKDEAIRLVLEGFDKGVFVRDISHDHESSWAVRQLPYLAALSRLIDQRAREEAP